MNSDELLLQPEEDPLYVMTVELEKGKSESIKIYSQSKPEELSYEFCKRHNLDFISLGYLTTQIRSLLGTVANGHQSIVQNDKPCNTECIIEEDEEDNQGSEQRERNNTNDNNNMSNASSINGKEEDDPQLYRNTQLETDKDIHKGIMEENEESMQEELRQYNEMIPPSLFSYQDFYNRLRIRLENKEQLYLLTASTINNNKTKSVINTNLPHNNHYDKGESLSIKDNEKKLCDFFKQLTNFDDIFQNKICTKLDFTMTNTGHNNNTASDSDVSHLKTHSTGSFKQSRAHTHSNFNNDNKTTTSKSISSHFSKQRNHSSNGNRLYRSGIQMKENTNQNLLLLKQRLEQAKECDNTFNPLINKGIKMNRAIWLNNKQSFGSFTDRHDKQMSSKADCSYSDKYKQNNNNNQGTRNNYHDRVSKSSPNINKYIQLKEETKDQTEIDVLFIKKKGEIFKKIFHLLDSDKDSLINIITMDTSRLPSTIYNIIKPIIYEIKQSNQSIKESDFVNGCLKLFNVLSFNNRRALLDFSNKIS